MADDGGMEEVKSSENAKTKRTLTERGKEKETDSQKVRGKNKGWMISKKKKKWNGGE